MSTHYEPHDSRSQYSRRHDPLHRSHDDHHHSKHTAGQHSQRRHAGEHHESYRQHSSRLGEDMDRVKHHRRSASHTYRAWPPHPFVEDEVASLRREAGGLGRIKAVRAQDEVPCRGKIDQEHLIDEVYDGSSFHGNSGRTGIPTPPTSEDERARKAKRRPSRILTDLNNNEIPELSRRTASPYAFTRQSMAKEDNPALDQFLSPNNSASARSDRKGGSSFGASRPSSPRTDSGRLSPEARRGKDYFASSNTTNDSAIDDSDLEHHSRRKNTAKSSRSNTSGPSSHSSVADFADPSTIRKFNQDDRRNTDYHKTSTPVPVMDKLRKPGTWNSSIDAYSQTSSLGFNLRPDSYEGPVKSRESSFSGSRAPSPTNNLSATSGTPPRSPRMSVEAGSREPSVAGSRAPSISGSRPTSPSPRAPHESPRMPRPDLDWGAAFAANAVNAAKKTKPPSRLSTSMRQESVPDMRRSRDDMAIPQANAPLPYPEDDSPFIPSVAMPSERDHQFFGIPTAMPPHMQDHRSNISPISPSSSKTPSSPSRPSMHRGYSTSVLSPPGETKEKPRRSDSKADTYATSPQTRKELAALLKKSLPPCPRPEPVSGYDDWYTVIGAPNLDFCPECVSNIFERTIFRPSLRLSPPRSRDAKVRCTFGSQWNRIAWLLTLQQQRTDLNLLKDLTEIEKKVDPCPGNQESVRQWYGLRDPEGLFVRDFHICPADLQKLERLLPSFIGVFDRLPSRASFDKRTCALRTEGNRFRSYMDAIVTTHDNATPSSSSSSSHRKTFTIDPMPLIDLIERKTRFRECTRDNMLRGATWHTIPGASSLTICEDCFDSVVTPELRRISSSSSDLGPRLHRSTIPAPVRNEGDLGSSCQLYSRRMRKVFRRAVDDDDVEYLARKAKDRRKNELRLQGHFQDIVRSVKRLEELQQQQEGNEVDEDVVAAEMTRLNNELLAISKEWKRDWE